MIRFFCLLLLSFPAAATNYVFPGTLPSGCSGSAGSYTCGALSLNWNDTIAIATPTPASITFNGDFNGSNTLINSGGASSNLTLIVKGNFTLSNSAGALIANLSATQAVNSSAPITGNVSAGTTFTTGSSVTITGNVSATGAATPGYNVKISGSLSAASISDGGTSTYGGGITATTGSINLGSSTSVTGNLVANNGNITVGSSSLVNGAMTSGGNVNLGSPVSVTGNVTATGTLTTGWLDGIGGDVSVGSLSDGGNVVYGGAITANTGNLSLGSYTTVASDVTAASGRITLNNQSQVSGNVIAQSRDNGSITLNSYSQAVGCVMTSSNDAGITLGWQATVGGVCCNGNAEDNNSGCSTRCVNNNSGYSMPSTALCTALINPLPTPTLDYQFDETSWSGTAGEVKDSSGNALNGTASSATTTTGKLCNGGSFNGTSSYVNLPNSTSLNFSSGMGYTFSTWIKTTDAYGEIVSFRDQSNDVPVIDLAIGYNGAGGTAGQFVPLVRQNGGGIAYLNSGPTVNDGSWHFVALVYDPAVGKITSYVDGAQAGSATLSSSSALTTTGLRNIGREGRWVLVNFTSQSNEYFNGQMDELKIWNSALSATQIGTVYSNENAGKNWDGSTRTCAATSTAPAALNAVDVGANAVSGKISTKTAGSAFNLDLYALNAAHTAADGSSTATVLVDLLANSSTGTTLDANNCPITATTLAVGTATLAAGKVTASMGAIANSWRDVRVRLRYPATGTATVTACSSDNFAVKPSALSVLASDADWQTAGSTRTLNATTASGTPTHKAGQAFTILVSGYNAANVLTSNYNGSPTASVACVLPATCAGSLSVGSLSASGGTLTSNTASFSDAGAIAATFTDTSYASVDSGDTAASCAGYWVCSSATNIGRFVPDHFAITPGTLTPGCGGFSYYGQNFSTAFTLTAQASSNSTTQNYSGLGLSAWSNFGFSTASALTSGAAAPTGSWVNGVASVTASQNMTRAVSGTPPSPASLTITALPVDSDGVTMPQAAAINSTATPLRFGRLRLLNATGSEYLPLPLPLTTQYWNGTNWTANTDDNCTTISAPTLTFYSQTADNQLTTGETTASFNTPLIAGSGNLQFSAPGKGNYGYLDLSITAPAWLKYNWDGVASAGNLYDDNPHARATFGRRSGSNKVIIRRELY